MYRHVSACKTIAKVGYLGFFAEATNSRPGPYKKRTLVTVDGSTRLEPVTEHGRHETSSRGSVYTFLRPS